MLIKAVIDRSRSAVALLRDRAIATGILWGAVGAGVIVAVLSAGPPRELAEDGAEARSSISSPNSTSMPLAPNFSGNAVSGDAQRLATWIGDSRDPDGRPFFIIDKQQARLYVFEPEGKLRAHTAVLLGSAPGDHTVPGIGERAIADVLPHERTTPAGRFIGERGRNMRGEDVIWVDYEAAVSLHRVLTSDPAEQRLERLATPSVLDNRISFGCINVPAAFFDSHVMPLATPSGVVVYILPEVHALGDVFDIPDRAERAMVARSDPGLTQSEHLRSALMDPWFVAWTTGARERRH